MIQRRQLLAGSVALVAAPLVRAQQFPAKPVTVLVPFPAGGLADGLMRALAKATEPHLGQSIVVENRPGALGLLAANAMTRAQPDGYLLQQISQNVYRAPFLGKVQFDPIEFTYIIGLADYDHALAVNAASQAQNLGDIVLAAKKAPGKISVGTTGVGSTGHLLLEDFSRRAGVKFNHVPFKGAPELATALAGENLDSAFMPTSEGRKLGARLRLLAVFGDQRDAVDAGVPTAKEQGFDSALSATSGIAGPRGMPPAVVSTLYRAFKTGAEDAAYQSTLKNMGMRSWVKSPEELKAWVPLALDTEKRLVAQAGLTDSK